MSFWLGQSKAVQFATLLHIISIARHCDCATLRLHRWWPCSIPCHQEDFEIEHLLYSICTMLRAELSTMTWCWSTALLLDSMILRFIRWTVRPLPMKGKVRSRSSISPPESLLLSILFAMHIPPWDLSYTWNAMLYDYLILDLEYEKVDYADSSKSRDKWWD